MMGLVTLARQLVHASVWWVGMISITAAAVKAAMWYYRHFGPASTVNLADRYLQKGGGADGKEPGWAVVTGGSSGIGFEMVVRLLRDGFSVVVIALPHEERAFNRRLGMKGLDKLKDNQTCTFVGADAREGATTAAEVQEELAERIHIKHLRVLVHCIGAPNPTPKPLWEHDAKEAESIVNVNLVFAMTLTTLLLPGMFDGDDRKGIVFMSSQAGALPAAPLISCYGAAKAGLISLASSLAVELGHTHPNIDVVCAIPGRTVAGATLNWWSADTDALPDTFATPAQIADGTLNRIASGPIVSPYGPHALQLEATKWLPRQLVCDRIYREMAAVVVHDARA
eukprot:m.193471 g.193471  ORF g.193471 m.193471 type:complete len:340 (+) comp18924_c0_seq1:107-1126(+)